MLTGLEPFSRGMRWYVSQVCGNVVCVLNIVENWSSKVLISGGNFGGSGYDVVVGWHNN